jgi:hypothetical protein
MLDRSENSWELFYSPFSDQTALKDLQQKAKELIHQSFCS